MIKIPVFPVSTLLLAILFAVSAAIDAQEPQGNRYRVLQDGLWGFVDGEGTVVVPPAYEYAFPFSNGFTVVRNGDYLFGKRAFLNAAGEQVTDFVFDRAYHFVGGYGTAVRDGKWGFIAPDGSSPGGFVWDAVRDFEDGYAAVRLGDRRNGRWGLIDRTGAYVLEPVFESLSPVGEGFWAARNGEGIALFDPRSGEPQAFVYASVRRFTDGLIVASKEMRGREVFFVLDTRLQLRFQSIDEIRAISEGVVLLRVEDRYRYQDIASGQILGDPMGYDRAQPFENGVAIIGIGESWSSRRYGLLARDGQVAVAPAYTAVRRLAGGFLRARSEAGAFVLFRADGNRLSDREFTDTGDFSGGLCPVEVDGMWGYIDQQGAFAIPPQWDNASDFVDGVAVVRSGDWETGERWYINTEGTTLFGRSFQWAYTFDGALAHVAEGAFPDGRFGYINREGTQVWDMQN